MLGGQEIPPAPGRSVGPGGAELHDDRAPYTVWLQDAGGELGLLTPRARPWLLVQERLRQAGVGGVTAVFGNGVHGQRPLIEALQRSVSHDQVAGEVIPEQSHGREVGVVVPVGQPRWQPESGGEVLGEGPPHEALGTHVL
jgi:hypothetical protein